MPHDLRTEFKNELTRMCEKIRVKQCRTKQTYDKLHDDKKEANLFSYTVLVVYAQKNVS